MGKNAHRVFGGFKENYPDAPGVMGYYFSKDRHYDGSLALGGVESQYIDPHDTVKWFPVTDRDGWSIKMHDILVDGKPLHVCPEGKPCHLMVDTGSSLVTGPSLSMNKIWKAVGHHVDCRHPSVGPRVDIVIEGPDGKAVKFPMDPVDYVVKPTPQECQLGFGKLSLPGSQGEEGGPWVVGSSF